MKSSAEEKYLFRGEVILFAEQGSQAPQVYFYSDVGIGHRDPVLVDDELQRIFYEEYYRRNPNRQVAPSTAWGGSRSDAQIQYLEDKSQLYLYENIRFLEIGFERADLGASLRRRIPGTFGDAVIISEIARDAVRNTANLSAILPRIEAAHGLYDVIFSSHAIKYSSNIENDIARVDEVLRPGGVVFLEVPNCNSEFYRYNGIENSTNYYFNERGLHSISEYVGWEVQDISHWGIDWYQYKKENKKLTLQKNESGVWVRAVFRKNISS